VSDTYANVDGSSDPAAAVRGQERVDRWPQIRAYKRRLRELLADADPLLDVGCGPGGDLLEAGAARSIGVDPSAVMCRTAGARGAKVAQADGHALPFAAGTFAGVSADRVLQHVAAPPRVLAEMVRVLQPGGRLAIADPDQETLTIHVPDVRPELVDRVKALRRDVGYRNGRLVSSLPARLRELGVLDLAIEPFPLTLTDPDDAFGLPGWVSFWRERGGFTARDEAEWAHGVARARDHGFLYAVTYFVVSGRTSPASRDT
jgi:SAM-dependent methyltransferase